MKALLAILIVLLCTSPFQAEAAKETEYKVYLTAKSESDVPLFEAANQFACRDKIYGVVEISGQGGDNSSHTLFATWRNPSGEDQEVTEYPFQLINGSARVWVWLKLHRSAESSLTQFLNPTGGLEEFAGEWQLRIRIDDRPVATRTFELLC